MTEEELKVLDKDVKRLKRISSEWASQLHDPNNRAVYLRRMSGVGGSQRKINSSTKRSARIIKG
jgi:hypothetical protein